MEGLASLFDPDRVAVVGATDREGAVGRAILENLRTFEGTVVPVNPDRDRVLGLPCHPDPASAAPIDLAVVAVPPDAVLEAVRAVAETGTRAVVVITAGFAETGEAGARRERELRGLAEEYGLTLVGPNSLGVISTPAGLNASFAPIDPLSGSISLLSQSGAFVTAVLDWAKERGIGVRDVVSLGNATVIDETDVIDHWGEDPGTEVIVGYLEGIEDGQRFIDVAGAVSRTTPVVLVKAGRTAAGAKAASSHTGSIAGRDEAYEAGLAQAGVVRADSIQELFDAARALAGLPGPADGDVAVVTNAGGPGVLATDAVGDADLSMAELEDGTVDALESALPAAASSYNPVDVIGDADAPRFGEALDVVLEDPGVGAVLVVSAPTAVLEYGELARTVVAATERHEAPVVPCLMGGARVDAAEEILSAAGLPNYVDPARAVGGLEALATHERIGDRRADPLERFEDTDREAVDRQLSAAAARGQSRLGAEATRILEAYGIPTPAGAIVDDPAEGVSVARSIDGDVVVKVVSPDIAHKTDIGAVRLGVGDDEVADAVEDVISRARAYQPDATILGAQIQEQVALGEATETLLGVTRDPQFGPLIVFGLGGIFVEVLEDTAVRVAPFGEATAREMIEEVRAAALLRGARGREPADVDAVVEAICRTVQLVTDHPSILELDINPLAAGPDGVTALDLVLTIDTDRP